MRSKLSRQPTLNSPLGPTGRFQSGVGKELSTLFSLSHSFDQILTRMMKQSDNIYAECLFYQTAATTGKKNAGRKEAAQRTEELLKKIGLEPSQYRVADGSGLSLYDYVSAEMLVAVLGYTWRTARAAR